MSFLFYIGPIVLPSESTSVPTRHDMRLFHGEIPLSQSPSDGNLAASAFISIEPGDTYPSQGLYLITARVAYGRYVPAELLIAGTELPLALNESEGPAQQEELIADNDNLLLAVCGV